MSPEVLPWEHQSPTSYEGSVHAVSSFRWHNVDDHRTPHARCQCAIAKRGGDFEPRSTPRPSGRRRQDHYPRLKADGGHLVPWNVRLSPLAARTISWRMRLDGCSRKGCPATSRREPDRQGRTETARSPDMVGQGGAKCIRLLDRTSMFRRLDARSHSAVGESTPAVRADLAIAPAAMTQGNDGTDDSRVAGRGSEQR